MPAIGPRKVKSRNRRSGRTSANALNWRARSARFRRRLSGTPVGASAPLRERFISTVLPQVTGFESELFRRPLVEALGQAVDVLKPESNFDLHRVLDVIRCGRQILQNGRLQVSCGILVRGPV